MNSFRSYSIKILFLIFLLSWGNLFAVESIQSKHITVSLVAPQQFGQQSSWIGIRYAIEPEWHVYWKNPGDSGAAPKINISSNQATIGAIQWPIPVRLPIGSLVNIGYSDLVILPIKVTPKPEEKTLNLDISLEWLVCNKEECIPGFAKFTINREVGPTEVWDDTAKKELNQFVSLVPQTTTDSSPWQISNVQVKNEDLVLTVKGTDSLDRLDIFPTNGLVISPQPPKKSINENTTQLSLKLQPGLSGEQSTGFVLSDGKKAWEWQPFALNSFSSHISLSELCILFLFSFLGGIILNLMPCVLPVLGIKFLSLVSISPKERVKQSLLYTLGVLTTFALLGGIFLLLRATSASVGWGFQLQFPLVVLFLIVLFWLMAMNFLGLFQFGSSLMNFSGKVPHTGSFATGALSVFVATPCTGPFMGAALGAATTLPALESFALFVFLGFGLAFPFVLIAVSPKLQKIIPKPGAWMEILKQFFAFPLLATVIWLLWVLHSQVGVDALPLSLGLLLTIGICFWWHGITSRFKILPWVLAILSLLYVGNAIHQLKESPSSKEQGASLWGTFSQEKVQTARAEGHPVFIDFTAAWCITCQINKKAVLQTAKAEELFKTNHVVLFTADWTVQDPAITKALAEYGRNSLPLYVFYPAGGNDAQILPQILTMSTIENLFKQSNEEKK